MSPPRITLYSSRRCPNCRRAREYLKQRGASFVELDVHKSVRAQKTLEKLGARGVPVIVIGETRIDGFDRRRIDAALAMV